MIRILDDDKLAPGLISQKRVRFHVAAIVALIGWNWNWYDFMSESDTSSVYKYIEGLREEWSKSG